MASSSHTTTTTTTTTTNHQSLTEHKLSKAPQNDDEQEEGEREQEEEAEEWLQLKLGLGSGTSCRKIVQHHHHHESNAVSGSGSLGLGLGLGLELQNESLGSDTVRSGVASDFHTRLLDWSRLKGAAPSWPLDSHHYNTDSNPHVSGLWFTLRSSTNIKGEALPQIPKAYIRVKNENTTVFMVKKYLVRKLGLSNENEIDIICMGESLLDVQTLRHVRDTIWIPAIVDSLNSTSKSLPDSRDMSTGNLMPLFYQKHPIL